MEWIGQSHVLQFLMICVMVVFAVAKVTLQGASSRRYIRGITDSVLFNGQLFAVIAVMLAILFPKEMLPPQGIALAACAAIGTFTFQVAYALALQNGPVSLSVLIVNFSVLIVTAFSILAFDEPVYLSHVIGIVFLVVSMLLSVKKEKNAKAANLKWLILLLVSLLGTSAGTILTQVFTRTMSSGEGQDNAFVITMYGAASAMAFICYAAGALGKKRNRCTYGFFNGHTWLFVLAIGAVLGIFQKLYMSGMKYIDGGFMFPTYAGLQSLTMTLVGILLFKDKLSKRQMLGIGCGIACVVLMNLQFVKLL